MTHRLLYLAMWTLIGGCWLATVVSSVDASQDFPATRNTPPPRTSAPSPRAAPDAVHRQMHALERNARVNMILYKGRFEPGDRAAAKTAPERGRFQFELRPVSGR